mgnify:FL=1
MTGFPFNIRNSKQKRMNTVVKIISACLLLLLAACVKNESSELPAPMADVRMEADIQNYLRSHNETAVRDVSGLYYQILAPGDSIHFVKATSVPTVIYTTRLLNGVSVGTSFGPTDFDHRELKNHIPGWQIGLQKISEGGRIRLFIPPALGYGSAGIAGVIPPNAILISEIELVSIR